MSRTRRGDKVFGHDYQGKRKGGWFADRRTSIKMQRMFDKEQLRKTVDESLEELCFEIDLRQDSVMKSLFPKAKHIYCFNDLPLGHSPVIVDGNYVCEIDDIDLLLSFQYHTGCNYKDYVDLSEQYFEQLINNERGWYLP